MSDKVLAIMTKLITDKMEQTGKPLWFQPWFGAQSNINRNLITNEPYHGINVILTSMMNMHSPFWLTFKQAMDKKLYLMPNQHYTPIVKWHIKEDKETGKVFYLGCNYFQVYNLSQFKEWENVKTPDSDIEVQTNQFTPIEICESIISNSNIPEIRHGGNQAYYKPSEDFIQMPNKEQFISSEHYYATLFHEIVHSTGAENRLNRKKFYEGMNISGKSNYSFEELVAEMGSCYLSHHAGIDNETLLDNSATYLQSWLQVFRNDVSFLPKAAQCSWKARNFILNEK